MKGEAVKVFMPPATRPAFIFDTSPLVTLAGATVERQACIEELLPLIQILVVETVAQEATVNLTYPDARLVKHLLDNGQIQQNPVPTTPVDHFIQAYPKLGVGRGQGERDTIRLGIVTPDSRVVMDDQQAFFVAARFDLHPLTLLDLIVELTRTHTLNQQRALQIVPALTGRYAPVSIQHTLYKLNEVSDDSNSH